MTIKYNVADQPYVTLTLLGKSTRAAIFSTLTCLALTRAEIIPTIKHVMLLIDCLSNLAKS